MRKEISNTDDLIDSRDVIARIDELEDELSDPATLDNNADDVEGMQAELNALLALAAEGEAYADDWQYGETLIRETYFKEYAQELAEDCGMVPDNAEWPSRCIDWDQAARELRMDYTELDFDGVAYLIRA